MELCVTYTTSEVIEVDDKYLPLADSDALENMTSQEIANLADDLFTDLRVDHGIEQEMISFIEDMGSENIIYEE